MKDSKWYRAMRGGGTPFCSQANLPGGWMIQILLLEGRWKLELSHWPSPLGKSVEYVDRLDLPSDPPDWDVAEREAALAAWTWASRFPDHADLARRLRILIDGRAEIPDGDIRRACYRKYVLAWMADHGYSAADLVQAFCARLREADPDEILEAIDDEEAVAEAFGGWESDSGFGGAVWACFEEFLDAEYHDEAYMKSILSPDEYQAYVRDAGRKE